MASIEIGSFILNGERKRSYYIYDIPYMFYVISSVSWLYISRFMKYIVINKLLLKYIRGIPQKKKPQGMPRLWSLKTHLQREHINTHSSYFCADWRELFAGWGEADYTTGPLSTVQSIYTRAANDPSVFTITEKAPTRPSPGWKHTQALSLPHLRKTLIKNYAKCMVTYGK